MDPNTHKQNTDLNLKQQQKKILSKSSSKTTDIQRKRTNSTSFESLKKKKIETCQAENQMETRTVQIQTLKVALRWSSTAKSRIRELSKTSNKL